VTAYNNRDEERLSELIADPPPVSNATGISVDDMSGIPHLGADHWVGVSEWAERGWSVDDRFELTRLVMYGGGSVFEVDRSNDVLRANGIESLHHAGKVHSARCLISQLVLYLPDALDKGSDECRFFEVFADDLTEGTTQSIAANPKCFEK
jgi:hypothetical protein